MINGPKLLEWNEQREKTFLDRYALKDKDGHPIETTLQQTLDRVSTAIAQNEDVDSRSSWAELYSKLMTDYKFMPGGRILAGAGSGYEVTLVNCYVLPFPEDSRGGIIDTLKLMNEIMARGGGVGINISSIRPRGTYIKTVNGYATGPVSWAELFSVSTGEIIQQGGSRRGALLLGCYDWHPDLPEFITVKRKEGKLKYANLSVFISDAFMQAVKDDLDWTMHWPEHGPSTITRTMKARELWHMIAENAWASGEPGLVFHDRMQRESNTKYFEQIVSVNPCGEEPLPAFGVCTLGSLNLAAFIQDDGAGLNYFDLATFKQHIRLAIRFLDNTIDVNYSFLAENEQVQKNSRRIGLGTMGLADALIMLKIRYGSDECMSFIDTVYSVLRDTAYETSVDLAQERGAFPAYTPEYLESPFIQRLPIYLQRQIKHSGIRNAILLCNAPTGTTSIVAGVSNGIEPVYEAVTRRKDRTGEHIMSHVLWEQYAETHASTEYPDYFVTAKDLTPEEHVKVQARVQYYIDASISKTCNLPNSATIEDIEKLYELGYDLGCKGLTVFRDGSREGVLSSVTDDKLTIKEPDPTTSYKRNIGTLPGLTKKVRYQYLGEIVSAFITVNTDNGKPVEVFGNGKSDQSLTAPLTWAISKLLQYGMSPDDIADELWEFDGGGAVFNSGCHRAIRSYANAIAWALEKSPDAEIEAPKLTLVSGQTCPTCKFDTVIRQSGCKVCTHCGQEFCG